MKRLYQIIIVLHLITINITAQGGVELAPGIPVTGTIEAGETIAWQFTAANAGDIISILVQSTSDNFDPVLTILDSNDLVVTTNDDLNYPANTDALLEAITIPNADTYTIQVSGFGDSTGEFTLTLLPGYGMLSAIDRFEDDMTWQPSSNDNSLAVEIIDTQLQLQLSGIQKTATVDSPVGEIPLTAYSTLDVQAVASSQNWQVGLTVRKQDADNYYAFKVDNQGAWRFILNTSDGETVIRDWSNHPALIPGQFPFTLSILSNGRYFDLFYNQAYLATIEDGTLNTPGQAGIFLATANAIGSEVQAMFDNFIVTIPTKINETTQHTSRIISTASDDIIRELQRRQVIIEGGRLTANIGESFAQFALPGVSRIPLIQNPPYERLAIGATITIESAQETLAGCGITIHDTDDTEYTLAYVDNGGGYGVSHFINDTFEPGIFGESLDITPSAVDILLVAEQEIAHYYINNRFVGSMELPTTSGQINHAVVNFEPSDTTCTFRDVWVWSWD